ncbi:hypothetical protein AB0D86_48140 [Streptomyces sp. NPDC048324]|uniref:hypothetical protein n=1 Tax=Streptomyces sp. NPDC048324 TaxID=3157205 RepID=UPI0034241D99
MSVAYHLQRVKDNLEKADEYAEKATYFGDGPEYVDIDKSSMKAVEMHRGLAEIHLEAAKVMLAVSEYVKMHKQNPTGLN